MTVPNLFYPEQVADTDTDNLFIQVVKYEPPGFQTSASRPFVLERNRSSNNARNTIGVITLPIPDNLSDRNAVTWDGDRINSLQLAGIDSFDQVLESLKADGRSGGEVFNDTLSTLGNVANNGLNAIKDPTIQDAIKRALSGAAVNSFGGNLDANSLISRSSGQVLNPNLELLFRGIILRNFNFNFTLTPRNQAEADNIKAIVKTFKRRMAAKSTASTGGGQGIFISAPDVFKMKFRRGQQDHPFLFDMKCCALTDMSVNYSGTGAYSTYEDATPVSMILSLNFRETEPVYNEDYNDDAASGVGF